MSNPVQQTLQRTLSIFSGIILTGSVTFSQTYYFDNYNVAEGLGQSTVYAVVVDNRHYIWLGTQSGVSRFDGKTFENFTKEDGIAPNAVNSLFEDSRHLLWLGHRGGGVTRWTPEGFEVIGNLSGIITKDITSIKEDSEHHIWISTFGSGVVEILNPGDRADELKYNRFKGDKLSDQVSGMAQTRDGSLYFLTDVGIRKLNAADNSFTTLNLKGLTSYFARTCMLEDREGNLWFGTFHGGLYKYQKSDNKFTIYDIRDGLSSNWISTIFEDSQGYIWVGTWGGGITRFKGKTLKVFNKGNGLQDNKIRCFAEDTEGNILIGTNDDGLSIFKGDQFVSFTEKDGLKDPQVWAICQDKKNRYWFGTNAGIAVYDPLAPASKRYSYYTEDTHVFNNQIRCIRRDKQGNMWIATDNAGIFMFDVSSGRFSYDPKLNTSGLLPPDVMNVTALAFDHKGILWFGTVEGLAYFDPVTKAGDRLTQGSGLPAREISAVFCDSRGRIWVGSKGSGIYLKASDSIRFRKLDTLRTITPRCFAGDDSDNVWIGTEGQGVFQMKNFKLVKHISEKNDLLANLINQLIMDRKGNLYIGTNKGLNKYVPSTGKVSTYTRKNGFTGIETRSNASYLDNDGNLWFGTVAGAIEYIPLLDDRRETEPVTMIRRLRVNYEERALKDNMELSYHENNIIFDYSCISLTNPEAVVYQVKLTGADVDWQPVTQQTMVTYPALTPKKYVFQVRARNNAGIWNHMPVSFSFQIRPPFYKTWWFIILSIVAGIIAIILYIAIREKQLIQEKKVLEDKVSERTLEVTLKNEELAMKNKDITDSLKYAQRLQFAMLMPFIPFRDTFILFKPKAIVSGDFYWIHTADNLEFMAAVDCTGHGVPGAFMSFIGFNSLNKIVKDYKMVDPSDILEHLNMELTLSLHQQGDKGEINDGMDIALVCFNRKDQTLSYAGAFNPLYICREGKLIEYKADRFPIGRQTPANRKFTNHTIAIQPGDTLYIFSDGLADQVGGTDGKKFKSTRIKELLLSMQDLDMNAQKAMLENEMQKWMGNEEQIDDVLFIGRRF